MSDLLDEIQMHLMDALRVIGKERKRLNALATQEKMKRNGTKPGRKKVRNDKEIKRLRARGLSIRAIAKHIKLSTMTVQRGLINE